MEVFPAGAHRNRASAALEKTVQFLQKIGPAGLPLLNLLSLKVTSGTACTSDPCSSVRDAQVASLAERNVTLPAHAQFYVDDIQDPHWVACVVQEKDGLVHVTLGLAPLTFSRRLTDCLDTLEEAGVLNWSSEKLHFPCVPSEFGDDIVKRGELRGSQTFKNQLTEFAAVYAKRELDHRSTRTRQDARNHDKCVLPDGYVLDRLNSADVPIIHKHWKYGGLVGAIGYITSMINEWPKLTCGIYRCTGEGDDDRDSVTVYVQQSEPFLQAGSRRELVAWGMVKTYGAIGLLHTLENHRRRGFAGMIVDYLETAMRQNSLHLFAYVDIGNDTSAKVFDKAGFQGVQDFKVLWLTFLPH